jgi:caffeoyl-CoA O-methyltransferase
MAPIIDPKIEEYAEAHTSPDPQELRALADETRRSFEIPQMMVGSLEGRFLQMLAHALRPQLVLEIGTFTGYSALSIAAALAPEGRIITCEVNERHAEVARRHIASSPYADRISVEVGPALETIARTDGPFDFVFIDADKVNYLNYLEAVIPKLSAYGLIAVDNTLWGGDVVDEAKRDPETEAIRRFNGVVAGDPRLVSVMLPIRDGVTLIRLAPRFGPQPPCGPSGEAGTVST